MEGKDRILFFYFQNIFQIFFKFAIFLQINRFLDLVFMEWLLNLALFSLTFLGGLLPLLVPSWEKKYANDLLAFSGAFLFAVCIGHILPESFEKTEVHKAGAFVIVGFFMQFVLQRLTHGVEHGHDCDHHHNDATAWSLFGGMAIHSFVEGLPLSTGYFDMEILIPLYAAILFHKIPTAIIVMGMFEKDSRHRLRPFFILALFAMLTPIGATIGYAINTWIPNFENALHWIIPIVAGSFLQIATTIFYETGNHHHKLSVRSWVLIILGVLLGMSSGLLHIH